jgi:hypothetical protein
MARDRKQLHQILRDLLGSANVYFQPPPDRQMTYPAIVYNRDTSNTEFAGNFPYKRDIRYQLTVIDRNPDSDIPGKVATLPQCTQDRWFAADGLNHDVFTIYF